LDNEFSGSALVEGLTSGTEVGELSGGGVVVDSGAKGDVVDVAEVARVATNLGELHREVASIVAVELNGGNGGFVGIIFTSAPSGLGKVFLVRGCLCIVEIANNFITVGLEKIKIIRVLNEDINGGVVRGFASVTTDGPRLILTSLVLESNELVNLSTIFDHEVGNVKSEVEPPEIASGDTFINLETR